jgi:hypothetical protein
MAKETCDVCGREFKNELAVKIHKGLTHGDKAKKAKGGKVAKAAAATAAPVAAAKGGVTCDICGRSFKLPAHLGRHKSIAHKAAARKVVAKPKAKRAKAPVARRPATTSAAGTEVADLSVDTLLALKSVIDARLAEIVTLMRKAKVNL